MLWCARARERKKWSRASLPACLQGGCVLAQLGVNTRENSFLIKILHSRVMNYIAQIDFNENSSFFCTPEKFERERVKGGCCAKDKRRRKLLAAARSVYTLLCEKKIAALIIPHLTLRLKKPFVRQLLQQKFQSCSKHGRGVFETKIYTPNFQ
jgi:hypothetical protein